MSRFLITNNDFAKSVGTSSQIPIIDNVQYLHVNAFSHMLFNDSYCSSDKYSKN